MKKVKETSKTVLSWLNKLATLTIAVGIALAGMYLLGYISVPELVVKAVGYGMLLVSAYYLIKNLK